MHMCSVDNSEVSKKLSSMRSRDYGFSKVVELPLLSEEHTSTIYE